jgi:hypothetical protein
MRGQVDNIDIVNTIDPDDYTSTVTGVVIDLQGYDSATIAFMVGTLTDGVHTVKVQHGDEAGGGDMADLDSTDWTGRALDILHSDVNQRVGYIGNKRYIRAVNTVSGGPGTGVQLAVGIVRGKPGLAPVAYPSWSSSSSSSQSSSSQSSSSSSSS